MAPRPARWRSGAAKAWSALCRVPRVLWRGFVLFQEHDGPRLAAALAYYLVFALAPLLIVVTYLVSLLVGPEVAALALNQQLELLMPTAVATFLEELATRLAAVQASSVTPLLGMALLLYSATYALVGLRAGLNSLWGAPPHGGHPLVGVLRDRALCVAGVLVIGVMLALSLVVNAALAVAGERLGSAWATLQNAATQSPVPLRLVQTNGIEALRDVVDTARLAGTIYAVAAVLVLAVVIFRWLPDARMPTGATMAGALVTSGLFWVGQWALGLYIARSKPLTAYGTAETIVVMLLWAYYSTQSLYFGAAVARAIAEPPEPSAAVDGA